MSTNKFLAKYHQDRLAELKAKAPVPKAAGGAGEAPATAVAAAGNERRIIKGSANLANLFNEARTRDTLLGKGGFGSVRRVTRRGRNYALKRIIFNNSVHKNNNIGVTPSKLFESEMTALGNMKNNPSAVHVINALQTNKNAYILTELLDPSLGFSLENISDHKDSLSLRLLQTIVRNLLLGLDSIHEIGYLHLDVKPNNIWIFNDGKIKYLDFGISCKMPCRLDYFPGTEGYRKNATPKVGSEFVFDKTNDFHGLGITLQKTADNFDYDSNESKYLIRIGKELLKLRPDEYAINAIDGAVRPSMPSTRRVNRNNSEEGGGGGGGGGGMNITSRPPAQVNIRQLRNMIPKTRKVSKKNVRQRIIDGGKFPENLINNNILEMYLGVGEAFENE